MLTEEVLLLIFVLTFDQAVNMGKINKYLVVVACICGSVFFCSASTYLSLWGKKGNFQGRSCYWQLSETSTVPPLEELTVCVDLRRQIHTSGWTAFVYKKPGDKSIELGLTGSGGNLKTWLFGKEWVIAYELSLENWHTVCLTWSNYKRQFQLIINGTVCLNSSLNDSFPSSLFPNGTLTLGVSHSLVGGVIYLETGTNFIGEITLFRMWRQKLSAKQTVELKCVSGNIIPWSTGDWKYHTCLPITDYKLKCEWSKYKINMKLSISQKSNINLNETELNPVVLKWLESIFPHNVSVNIVFLANFSQTYQTDYHLREDKNAENKTLNISMSEVWYSCLVYVTVSPGSAVDEVQAALWTLLIPTYNHSQHTLRTDPASVNILPVASIPEIPDNQQNSTKPRYGDLFYRIHMNLTIEGSTDVPQTIQLWLQQTLGGIHRMSVLNFKLTTTPKRNGRSKAFFDSRYGCTFQVQAMGVWNVSETGKVIFHLLTQGFSNGSIIIIVLTDQFSIVHIDPGNCPDDTTQTLYGIYMWPSIPAQDTYTMKCEKGHESAARLCKLDDSDLAVWNPPDMSSCEKVFNDIDDLESITVTPENSADVMNIIEDLLRNQTHLSPSHLNTVLQKLSEVTDIGPMTTGLANSIIGVVSKVIDSTTSLSQVTNQILSITDQVGNRLDFSGVCHNTTAPSLALLLMNQDPSLFQGLTFMVSSFEAGFPPEFFFNEAFAEESATDSVASISLPTDLQNFFPQSEQNISRIQFHFYGKEDLFQDAYSSSQLNSYVVSASVTNATVFDLKDPVVITLRHLKDKEEHHNTQCVYWDLEKNNRSGGWDDNGCQLKHTNVTHTSCLCFHLTHFGVLLDVSRTPMNPKDDMILTVISYLGCGMSAIFLSVTLLTYLAFEKLRRDYPSKILINLSAALLGLNLLFLLNSWLASFNSYGLCIATAAMLHYFFLASFTWMGLEAINMYLAFVKVFNVYVPSYILKFCALGWGLPLGIVILMLAIDKNCYGSSLARTPVEDSSAFCWIQDDTAFYVSVVAFVVLILFCNISVFVVVLVQIRGLQFSKAVGKRSGPLHDIRVVASLTFLLGLTWMLAFFAWGPIRVPFLYLFALLNSMQGFFIFLFHCLLKENVWKQWRINLCCGKFRLTDYSDWSGSVTLGGQPKNVKLVHSPSESTSERKTSDSSGTGHK